MQSNRLERVWEFVKPDLLKRWSLLTDEDLEACEGQYDLIVEAIRRAYHPGRSHLSLEAEIRDWLTKRICYYENPEKKH